VQVRLDELRLENPRQWGACWLADHLWRTLHLDDFFGARLPVSREGTDWEKVGTPRKKVEWRDGN